MRTLATRSTLMTLAVVLSLTGLPPGQFFGPTFPIRIVLQGDLTRADYEHVVEQPFTVPTGATRLEITLDHEGAAERTVIDLGLRSPGGLRGWSGGRETRIDVSRLRATPGYLPGPIEAGNWAVLLGVPNIREGRRDAYRLTIIIDDAELLPAPVINAAPGWYAGDLHAHSGHSDGRTQSPRGLRIPAPVHRVFDQARQQALDFVLLSDHNTSSHWLDVDRLQPWYDDVLLLHGREITTYQGHANTVGEREFLRFHPPSPRDRPTTLFRNLAATTAFISINHPRLPDDERCMGCGWNDTGAEVLSSIHGVEVVNGTSRSEPEWGWPFWADLLNRGFRLTAIGGSDDHTPDDLADRALGTPTTVVWARELSEVALVEGLKSGRVYVRVGGRSGPHVELSARYAALNHQMGSRIPVVGDGEVLLVAEVDRADGHQLIWIHNGRVARTEVVTDNRVEWLAKAQPGDWFSLQLRDAGQITALSNAVYFGAARRPVIRR